ncbi:lytic murein transglycosylase A precursor [Salmonella enterica subsp. enterica serovar Wandsworth str. A4-580]|uniref:Lytic murein transglycosylase A n=1 Tax=Salmonella enterica subsp. enterica serovar Wandsworth str. A4-580 TaxID=913086 RepID=G5SGB4_SALET|nr:lytic murein transglycosylase A precursor [Salmonella enterica subsp. enterica serovar Wandsworth str. A4-580]
MKGRWAKYVATGVMLAMLAACSSKPTDRGQQYKDGKFTQPFSLVNQPDAVGAPINAGDFAEQVNQIRSASPRLYTNQSNVYNAVQNWLRSGGDTRTMRQFGIDAWQMEGTDNYGNVQFTGYYTPVVQARHTRQGARARSSTLLRARARSSTLSIVCRQNADAYRPALRSTQAR